MHGRQHSQYNITVLKLFMASYFLYKVLYALYMNMATSLVVPEKTYDR